MIAVKGLRKSFGDKEVLDDVSFEVEEGDVFGIIGHSGAGKSTLLRCLNGLETYDTGSVKLMEKEVKQLDNNGLKEIRKNIGMIFQNFNLMNRKNVYENIAFPLEIWGMEKSRIRERVTDLLSLVGLSDKMYSRIRELSGGQKQRVGIARALALNPKVLLCDEATSALDPGTTRSILQLLMDINKRFNITIVVVTHQMEVIKDICNKVIILEGGEVKASGEVGEVFLRPNNELKKLMSEEEVLPGLGFNIRIFFPKEISQKCLITSIARELDVDFSIVWGKLEKFRGDVLGSLIINVDGKNKDKIIDYLNDKLVLWEMIENAD